MCGIFGLVDFEAAPIKTEALKKISIMLSRRGPDEEGEFIYRDEGVSCGIMHRRLSIIDLRSGKQPMTNEDNSVVFACNGEIYNYKEIRNELLAKGHIFKTNSDSEVILHAYEEYSVKCLDRFRGMFVFVIWDSRKRLLFIASDRVGKKPLYYHVNSSKIIFSSEIRCILSYGDIGPEVNRKAIYQYLSYCYVPPPETAFRGIYRLMPAEYMIFSQKNNSRNKYWYLDFSNKISITEKKAAEQTRNLICESVKLRMISDVPVGVFLSGGLDSSIVTAVMTKETSLPVETFSIGFEEKDLNELRYARIIQQYFNCNRNEVIMKPESFQRLPELIDYFGQPHSDSSALATMLLAQEAKKKITVALVGEGSDELFGGYSRYLYFRVGKILNKFGLIQSNMFRHRYKKWMGGVRESLQKRFFTYDFFSDKLRNEADAQFFEIFSESSKFKDIDSALFIDTNFFLPYDLLTKLDVSTMAYGVEARAPFLDHKLMEFAASLPSGFKLKGNITKFILREAFKDMLPPEISQRRKTGFVVPVHSWFRGELKNVARDMLLSSSARKRGYFNMTAVEEMLESHARGESNIGHEIWTLIVLELWHKRFFKEKP